MQFHVVMTAFHHECHILTFEDESEFRKFLIDEICRKDEDDDDESQVETEAEAEAEAVAEAVDIDIVCGLLLPLKDLIKLAIDKGNTRHGSGESHIGAVIQGDLLGSGYVNVWVVHKRP